MLWQLSDAVSVRRRNFALPAPQPNPVHPVFQEQLLLPEQFQAPSTFPLPLHLFCPIAGWSGWFLQTKRLSEAQHQSGFSTRQVTAYEPLRHQRVIYRM